MKKILAKVLPPPAWRLPVAVVMGILCGLGLYIFKISNAVSYLSDNPKTCVNCHVMNPEYATWFHSSHGRVTTCNDCHVPHDNFVSTYMFKAVDGMRHATIFTLRNEPQVIRLREAGKDAVQENCKRCHAGLNQNVSTLNVTQKNYEHATGKYCWECHREVPHGRVKSLSSTPYAGMMFDPKPVPVWLNNALNKSEK